MTGLKKCDRCNRLLSRYYVSWPSGGTVFYCKTDAPKGAIILPKPGRKPRSCS